MTCLLFDCCTAEPISPSNHFIVTNSEEILNETFVCLLQVTLYYRPPEVYVDYFKVLRAQKTLIGGGWGGGGAVNHVFVLCNKTRDVSEFIHIYSGQENWS